MVLLQSKNATNITVPTGCIHVRGGVEICQDAWMSQTAERAGRTPSFLIADS